MRITKTIIAVLGILITGLIACSSSNDENKIEKTDETIQPLNEPEKLPSLTMTDAAGNTVNLSSFKGRKVFVNLWATWCPPCREEIPSIEALAGKVDKENTVFVMLSLDKSFEVAKNFASSVNLKVPVYYAAEKLPELFDIDGIPATFIFNEKGDLIKQNYRADDYDTDLYFDLLTKK